MRGRGRGWRRSRPRSRSPPARSARTRRPAFASSAARAPPSSARAPCRRRRRACLRSAVSWSTRWRNRSVTNPRATPSRTRRANGSISPGAGAPRDVKARHGVPVLGGEIAAALGPTRRGEEPDALVVQPLALLAGGELDVRLGPAARPGVLGAVEAGAAEPVLERELGRVANPAPALLGAVDEEQAAERPERLAAERSLGLLVEQDHAPAGVGELGGGDQTGEAGADDDHIGVWHARGVCR